MTVSANSTLEFTRDQILRMSFQLCGLLPAGQPLKPADASMGADFMNLELESLQAEGDIGRSRERTSLTLAASTAAYSLPAPVIDVFVGPNDDAGTIVGSTGAETRVTAMSLADYGALSSKAITGRPTRVLIEKQSTVNLTFWPIPDATSVTFKYAKVRLLADADAGNVTLDLSRRWLLAVAYLVAFHIALAKSLGLDRANVLKAEGERLKSILKADDSPRGNIRMSVMSGRRW